MATKNFAANLKIGAVMGASVGRVFGALKTKIKDQENTLKGLRAAYKQAEKGTGEYAGKLDQLKGKIDAAEKELKKLKAASNFDIGKSLKGIGSTFVSDFKRLGVAAGLATGAVLGTGAAVYSITKGFVDWADDIGDSAEALGMSTQALQTWQFAAATVGVEGGKMTASIAKFSKAVMDGGKQGAAAFAKLGINAARLKKLKLDEQLKVTAEAFKRYKGADKAAIAMKLFGKSGYQLTGILSKGADGFEEFKKLGEETGAVLTDEAAQAAGDAATALDKFGITMTGLRNTIAIQFVPALGRLADQFTKLIRDNGPKIREWAAKFAEVIETRVVPALGSMMDKLPAALDKIGELATGFWNGLTAVKDFVGGWDHLGYTLLAANFAPTILAIGNLAKGLWSLGAAAWGATGPIGLIVAGIAATGYATYLWYQNLDKTREWFNNLPTWAQWIVRIGAVIAGPIGQLALLSIEWDRVKIAIGQTYEKAKIFFEVVKTWATMSATAIRDAFTAVFVWLGEQFDAITSKITDMWNRAKALGEKLKGFFTFGAGPAQSSNTVAPQIMPPDAMPARDRALSQNNNTTINVTTPATNGAQFGRELRQEINRKPLFDMSGALVPG